MASVADIETILPQTQCGLCGYPACTPYAEAVVSGHAPIDRCMPGGLETLHALATLMHQDPVLYEAGVKMRAIPEQRVIIDEAQCIGCTKCIQACPVSAIVGVAGCMHTVLIDDCTGCALCIAPCPVDCITQQPVEERSTEEKKRRARLASERYRRFKARLARQKKQQWLDKTTHQLKGETRAQTIQARKMAIKQSYLRVQMKQKTQQHATRVAQIFRRLRTSIPSPQTELVYNSPFELLVAVVLSARATDVSVNQATQHLFPVARTPEQLLALGPDRLASYVKHIGLYQSKVTYLLKTAQLLLDQHQGKVPRTRVALEALPGVGRKTANVLLNTLYGDPVIAVDTHVFRVSHRLGFSEGKTPKQVEDDLMQRIPPQYLNDAHHLLILHGRYVCKAQKPACSTCVLRNLCEYHATSSVL